MLSLHIEQNVPPRLASSKRIEDVLLFPKARGSVDKDSHSRARVLQLKYDRVFDVLNVISPITGERIAGNPRRDRHTLLTMLAMNGCTAEEIAANAGHTSPRSCQAYVDASADHFQRMEEHVGAAFMPIADRFMGRIVAASEDQNACKNHSSICMMLSSQK